MLPSRRILEPLFPARVRVLSHSRYRSTYQTEASGGRAHPMPLPLCQAPADAEASDTEGAERGALQRWDWKGLTYVQTHIPHDRSLARTQASTQKQTGARKRTRANTSKPHLLGAHAVLDAREALPDVALRRGDAAPQLGRLREVVNENQVVAVAADNQKIETKE